MKRKSIILVVDDDNGVLKLFDTALRDEYKILTVNNGREALELANKKKPDLVILDLKMPDMSGIEILRRINRIDENIEVIIITGYGTMKSARVAMKLGAYDYITKPFQIDYVKGLIKDALSPTPNNIFLKIR
jgi:DNA-binding NtrC family response regulator